MINHAKCRCFFPFNLGTFSSTKVVGLRWDIYSTTCFKTPALASLLPWWLPAAPQYEIAGEQIDWHKKTWKLAVIDKMLYGWHGKPAVYKWTWHFCSLQDASSNTSCGAWIWPQCCRWQNSFKTESTTQNHPMCNSVKAHFSKLRQCRSVSEAKQILNGTFSRSRAMASVPSPLQSDPTRMLVRDRFGITWGRDRFGISNISTVSDKIKASWHWLWHWHWTTVSEPMEGTRLSMTFFPPPHADSDIHSSQRSAQEITSCHQLSAMKTKTMIVDATSVGVFHMSSSSFSLLSSWSSWVRSSSSSSSSSSLFSSSSFFSSLWTLRAVPLHPQVLHPAHLHLLHPLLLSFAVAAAFVALPFTLGVAVFFTLGLAISFGFDLGLASIIFLVFLVSLATGFLAAGFFETGAVDLDLALGFFIGTWSSSSPFIPELSKNSSMFKGLWLEDSCSDGSSAPGPDHPPARGQKSPGCRPEAIFERATPKEQPQKASKSVTYSWANLAKTLTNQIWGHWQKCKSMTSFESLT